MESFESAYVRASEMDGGKVYETAASLLEDRVALTHWREQRRSETS